MVGWWNGDANTRDDSGNGNNGTLQGNYRLGKVGQAFNFAASTNDGLVVRNSPSVSPPFGITLDAWVRPGRYANLEPIVFRKGADYQLSIGDDELVGLGVCKIGDTVFLTGGSVPLNVWTHLACTYDGEGGEAHLYINGREVASQVDAVGQIPTTNQDLSIGKSLDASDKGFDGQIDEAEIFDRALDPSEIKSLVAAQASGKCKFDFLEKRRANANQIEASSTVTLGDATITYNDVISQHTTNYQTLDTYQAGPMPFGYNTPLEIADISSDTTFNGTARVCFNLQSLEFGGSFQQLRILHLEGNDLVNRTSSSQPATRTLCADVSSLSPFVIAQNVNAPSASSSVISGRITLPDGSPLGGVVLQLSGAQTRETITDANGLYSFAGVTTGRFYTVTPQRGNFSFSPRERSFSVLGSRTEAAFSALPDAVATVNPLDSDLFFVRQQYLDFLGREPDAGGLAYWVEQLRNCGGEASCLRGRRLDVSAAFFDSREFQDSGSFVYRLYQGSLGRRPQLSEFTADRRQVSGGNTEADQLALSEQFVARAEFVQRYQGQPTAETFVAALLDTVWQAAGVDLSSERENLLAKYGSRTEMNQSRALVLASVANNAAFRQGAYNRAFVLMEYFGYLGRNPDPAGYEYWLEVLNNRVPGNYRAMVCAFITSAEYQQRFSTIVSRNNSECGQ